MFTPTSYEATAGGYHYRSWSYRGIWYVMRGKAGAAWIPPLTQVLQTDGWVGTFKRQEGKDHTFSSIEEVTEYLGILVSDTIA